MQVKVSVTTTVTDGRGVLTEVTTVDRKTIGDNPRMVRSAIVQSDVYDAVTSLNLDQVEAGFSRG